MDSANTHIQSYPSRAVILAQVNVFSEGIVMSLIRKGIFVHVVSDDSDGWKTALERVRKSVEISTPEATNLSAPLDYLVYIDCDSRPTTAINTSIQLTKNLLDAFKPKAVGIFPFQVETEKKDQIEYTLSSFQSAGRIPASFYVDTIYDEVLEKIELIGDSHNAYYPVTLQEIIRIIQRSLFSFGNYDEKIALLGKRYPRIQSSAKSQSLSLDQVKTVYLDHEATIEASIASSVGSLSLNRVPVESTILTPHLSVDSSRPKDKVIIPHSITASPRQIMIPKTTMIGSIRDEQNHTFQSKALQTAVEQNKKGQSRLRKVSIELPKIVIHKKLSQSLVPITRFAGIGLVVLVVAMIIVPILMHGVGIGMVVYAKSSLLNDNYSRASIVLSGSDSLSRTTAKYLRFLAKGSTLEHFYGPWIRLADNQNRISDLGKLYVNVRELTDKLVVNVFDKNQSEIATLANDIRLELDSMYYKLGFLETSLEGESLDARITDRLLIDLDINDYRTRLYVYDRLVTVIPDLAGESSQTSFIIAIQDASIHRPTGGVITSLLIPTFSGGKVVDLDVLDADYIDAQIKGQVEVPELINAYLTPGEWSIKDANVESEFSKNAEHLLWYVDKSLDLSARGVISVDQHILARLADSLAIDLPANGYSDSIRTFSESALTSIGQSSDVRNNLYSTVPDLIRSKEIEYFLTGFSGSPFNSYKLSGQGMRANCNGNCYSDVSSVIEISQSDSPDKNAIVRSAHLTVSFEKGLLKRNMVVTYENTGTTHYRALVGVVAPSDAGFDPIRVIKNVSVSAVEPQIYPYDGYKQVFAEMNLLPTETVTYSYNWESGSELDSTQTGDYHLHVQKQSGLTIGDVSVFYSFPHAIDLTSNTGLSLTNDGLYRYNTQLESDLTQTLSW